MKVSKSMRSWSSLWSRRFVIFVAVVIWLLVMLLPALALFLAVREELIWHRGEYTLDRIWLVKERSERGLGWASTRVDNLSRETVCLKTEVRFWLWKGNSYALDTSYCECYRQQPDHVMEYFEAC